jgi:hypothetical protein
MIFRIPVAQELVRSFKDPHLPKTKIVHALVAVNDLPNNIPLDPDPRTPKPKGPIVKRISASLKSNDGRFHLLNRGICISARAVEFDPKVGILKLQIPSDEPYGIIDGGHSYYAITSVVSSVRDTANTARAEGVKVSSLLANQYVHLEILVGVEEHLPDIAEARNFSVTLKAWTIAGYREKFEPFLIALGDDFRRFIKTSENDEEPVGILDLIQVMCAMNPTLFPPSVAPLEAYKNAGKCLEYFVEKDDRYEFRKLDPVCRDIVKLYDHIRARWKDVYNAEDESGKRGRLGARNIAEERKRNRTAMATYYFLGADGNPVKGDIPIEKGFAIPLISSFRALLEEHDGGYHWQIDPFEFFDQHGKKLVSVIMAANDKADDNANAVGRDANVYTALYDSARRWYLERFAPSPTTM